MLDGARETLVRAMDHLDATRDETGDGRTYLVVSWAHTVEGKTTCGWAATDDPPFMLAAMMYRVAEQLDAGEEQADGDE